MFGSESPPSPGMFGFKIRAGFLGFKIRAGFLVFKIRAGFLGSKIRAGFLGFKIIEFLELKTENSFNYISPWLLLTYYNHNNYIHFCIYFDCLIIL